MTIFEARTILICLAMVSVIATYPVGNPQTAENKGRGRSFPLIISHYSNVRNSKYNSPPATEAPTTTTASAVLAESDDLIKPKVDEDDDDVRSAPAASDDAKKNEEEEEKADEKVQDEAKDEKSEKHDAAAVPDMAKADSAAPVNVAQNESISVATPAVEAHTPEDSLQVSKAEVEAVPSNEKTEVVEKTQEPKVGEGSANAAVKESAATGTTLTHVQEEVQPTQTTSSIEADKPAALGESEKTDQQVKGNPEMDIPNTTNAAATVAAADSVAKIEEAANEEVKPSETIAAPAETAKAVEFTTEQVKVEEAAVAPSAEVKVTPESTPVESSRTAVLATEKEKTSEFFEEDRSFKDRPDPELILAAIRQSAAAALGVGEEQKVLPAQIDDVANEGIRLQRDDNKKTAEKKEKEKEKYSAKPTKEKKPVKPTQSNDPVQEYDDIVTRSGKSKDDAESTTDTTVDKAVTSDEPVTVGHVPTNYPVVLPDGGSTLSHQIASAESPKEVIKTPDEASTTSLTPTNYPVILPSGESTLSDKIAQDDTSAASEEPVIISLVPSNYPVVLPSGESTLSDKVKPEDLESPKTTTGEN
ncbi:uncharacterized protein LOC130702582 isoform X2 [Daphnia carinata]|uniref:uncharacterized protein LOC130702582 isoform X2 n=1 Tax=Daphnia carinata TaxID=120202 RepID=UPI0025809EE7|nr:uncharacterized protein LOC130702582 isoform X2 [Daphnia carinata]